MIAAKPTLVMSESVGFAPEALSLLRRHFNVKMLDADRQGLLAAVRRADVLWVRLRHRIDAGILASAPKLKVIASPTTGLNHIDQDETEKRGINILSLRGETEFLREVRATAELTVALMLSVMRKIPDAVSQVKKGEWNRDRWKGCELAGRRIGIVGHGRLGRLVAGYAEAFDCDVVTSDPDPVEPPDVPLVPLEQLLATSDIVTLHVNLDAKTKGFFDEHCFRSMKPGAWFVNTARGELVDEAALLGALESGQLAGAALDVLAHEDTRRMGEHPVVAYARAHDNLIITPHIGGATFESMARTELFLAEKLARAKSKIFVSELPLDIDLNP
jgi:D-3-phosphoglycerate dehydrogenase